MTGSDSIAITRAHRTIKAMAAKYVRRRFTVVMPDLQARKH